MRHGESVFTEREILNGDPAIAGGLTELGRKQVEAAAVQLRDDAIELCISSDFPRTRETAAILLEGRTVRYEVMPELNDPPVGSFEGQPYPDYFDWVQNRDWHDTAEGCESQFESVTRYLDAWERISQRDEPTILVVAHAFVTSFALTLADTGGPALRLHYEKEVDLATPYRIQGDALRAGVERARKELAAIGVPTE